MTLSRQMEERIAHAFRVGASKDLNRLDVKNFFNIVIRYELDHAKAGVLFK